MADLLSILGMGAVAKTRADTATLEGQQVKRDREQKDLLTQLAQQRQVQQDAQAAERTDLLNALTRAQTAQVLEPPKATPRRTQVVDGQLADLDTGVTTPLQGYVPPQQKPSATTPVRGTPEYNAMLEAEARARATGGGAERGAQLPAPAIEKMITLDNVIGQAKRAREAADTARRSGSNFSGRVGGILPVPAWARNAVQQGGEQGMRARNFLGDLFSQVANMRSGGAITPQEFDRLSAFLPDQNDDEGIILQKLDDFLTTLEDMKRVRVQAYQQYGKPGMDSGVIPTDEDGNTFTTSTGKRVQVVRP